MAVEILLISTQQTILFGIQIQFGVYYNFFFNCCCYSVKINMSLDSACRCRCVFNGTTKTLVTVLPAKICANFFRQLSVNKTRNSFFLENSFCAKLNEQWTKVASKKKKTNRNNAKNKIIIKIFFKSKKEKQTREMRLSIFPSTLLGRSLSPSTGQHCETIACSREQQ